MSRRNKELGMRKIREIIRLSMSFGLGNREISRSCNISHTVVNRHIIRVKPSGLSYARIEGMDDKEAEVFVAVLGASNYTYAKATCDQSLASWISSHIKAFEHFGG